MKRGQLITIRNRDSKFNGMTGRVRSIFDKEKYFWELLIYLDDFDHGKSHGLFFSPREVVRR